MSLQSLYQAFLAAPNAAALAEGASFNYITTLTTVNTPAAIIKHLTAQQRAMKKKQEKVISTIESSDGICLDVETTLEFLTSGGAYLPGLDDNFLADRVVTFPIVHVVHFDANKKIHQVRLYWDQGSLLKLVDVIGARARNWPICDGKDQARLIASSAASTAKATSNGTSSHQSAAPGARDLNEVVITSRNLSPTKRTNVTGDPHASLSLFGPRDANEDTSLPAVIAPRASAKPPPRDYHDLFVGHESDSSPAEKSKSPTREPNATANAIAPKGGAGKNYLPSRLFGDIENPQPGTPGTPHQSPDKFIKPHPKKYNHFEFGEGSDGPVQQQQPKPMPTHPKSKDQSQWDFEDFVTPEKVPQKIRGQDVRHFGWSDDEGANMESPVKHPKVTHPRPDAQTNFEFKDDGMPAGDRRPAGHPRGQGHKNGLGLYQNNLYDDEELPSSPEKKHAQPLSTVTNVKDRKKDFDPHFSMTDDSPAPKDGVRNENKAIPEDRKKVVKMMDANWGTYDQSPEQSKQSSKENYSIGANKSTMNTGIKAGGDGMG
ncbi:MAG: hypothetical protein M1830_007083, partial [Pleopsidium flavum]